MQFTLTGTTVLTWQVDIDTLTQDLVGKNKAALDTVMGGHPSIKSAQAAIRPFWKKDFPTDPSSISVEIMTTK